MTAWPGRPVLGSSGVGQSRLDGELEQQDWGEGPLPLSASAELGRPCGYIMLGPHFNLLPKLVERQGPEVFREVIEDPDCLHCQ